MFNPFQLYVPTRRYIYIEPPKDEPVNKCYWLLWRGRLLNELSKIRPYYLFTLYVASYGMIDVRSENKAQQEIDEETENYRKWYYFHKAQNKINENRIHKLSIDSVL